MLMLLKETSVSSFSFLITNINCITASVFLFLCCYCCSHHDHHSMRAIFTIFLLSDVYWVYTELSFLACFLHHCAIAYSYTHTICTALFLFNSSSFVVPSVLFFCVSSWLIFLLPSFLVRL